MEILVEDKLTSLVKFSKDPINFLGVDVNRQTDRQTRTQRRVIQ